MADDEKLDQWSAAYHGTYTWFVQHDLDSDNINKKDGAGRTALYTATRKGHLSIVVHLVTHGAYVNCLGPQNSTPLHVAAYKGHGSIVQFLVGFGCNRNLKNLYGLKASDEAKTDQIKKMILYPERGSTERFKISKRDLPAFLNDIESLVRGSNALLGCDKMSRADVIKSLGKNIPNFAAILKQIIKADENTWNMKLLYLYTLESPLYKKMNADLSGVNKLSQYRVYANHLANAISYVKLPRWKKECYRSIHLNPSHVQGFKKSTGRFVMLPAFSSCTKSKKVALGWGGNAILIIYAPHTKDIPCDDYVRESDCAVDISSLSQFSNEEEVLLTWSTQLYVFGVKSVEHYGSNVKYQIEVQITNVGW